MKVALFVSDLSYASYRHHTMEEVSKKLDLDKVKLFTLESLRIGSILSIDDLKLTKYITDVEIDKTKFSEHKLKRISEIVNHLKGNYETAIVIAEDLASGSIGKDTLEVLNMCNLAFGEYHRYLMPPDWQVFPDESGTDSIRTVD